MKKTKKILVLAFCLFSFNTFAQNTYFDILLNYSPSHFNYGDANDELKDYRKNLNGIQAGFSFQAGVSKHFTAVAELYYMQKGSQFKENNPITHAKTKTRLHMIEMPVLGRVHLGRFYVNAGPTLAYQMSGKVTIDATEATQKTTTKIDFGKDADQLKRWDAGIDMGGGYELPVKNLRLVFDVRYHVGLVNISNVSQVYNRSLLFNIMISKPWKTNPLAKK